MKQRRSGDGMSDEERRVGLQPALVELKGTVGEQGRLINHLIGKVDKVLDLVTDAGKWQAGHQAMTGEHEKVLHNLRSQAGDVVERLTTVERRLDRHAVKIGVLWAIVGALGVALAAVGMKVFAEHLIKGAMLMVGGGLGLAAFGWERAILAFKGLL